MPLVGTHGTSIHLSPPLMAAAGLNASPSCFSMEHPTGSASRTIEIHKKSQELVFISDWASPFSQRTWMALEHRRIPYRYQEATEAEKANDTLAIRPGDLLPAFEVRGTIIRGSVNLIEYLEDAYPTYEPHLLARDALGKARERMWNDSVRKNIIPAYIRLTIATDVTLQDAASIELCKALDLFVEEVRGPYFSGPSPSIPDISLGPFIARLRFTRFKNGKSGDAGAGAKYQVYAERIMALECLRGIISEGVDPLESSIPMMPITTRPTPRLPPELIGSIMNHVGDYELASTLGTAHSIPETTPWKEQATPLDRSILTGSLKEVQQQYQAGHKMFSAWGARLMVRFGYTHLLGWLLVHDPAELHRLCDYVLPEVASAWGRVSVLDWALASGFGLPRHLSETAIDEASRNGQVETLEWWKRSGLAMVYSEHALNSASVKRQIATLEWWRGSGLTLKIGNVLDFASMEGSTEVLEWWARSGLEGKYSKTALYHVSCTGNVSVLDWWRASRLPLVYDKDVIVGATKNGRVESLEWWAGSGLPVYYTYFDVEEALEDCVGGVEARRRVEEWWAGKGLIEGGGAGEWTRTRMLRN